MAMAMVMSSFFMFVVLSLLVGAGLRLLVFDAQVFGGWIQNRSVNRLFWNRNGIQADVFRQRLLLLLLVNQNPILLSHRVAPALFVAGGVGVVRRLAREIK